MRIFAVQMLLGRLTSCISHACMRPSTSTFISSNVKFVTISCTRHASASTDVAMESSTSTALGVNRSVIQSYFDRLPDLPPMEDASDSAKTRRQMQKFRYEWQMQITAGRDLNAMMHETKTDHELQELAAGDHELIEQRLSDIEAELAEFLLQSDAMYANETDELIVEVYAGAGGNEAMLFAGELLQMYHAYAAYRNWVAVVMESDRSSLGGVRSASLSIKGDQALQWMQYEGGVHRIQRVPATEKSGRLHTSTASVAVLPVPSEVEVGLSNKDLEFSNCKASGPGGMNINANATAARVKHIPSGIAVECQQHRTLLMNQEVCLKKLRAILYEQQWATVRQSVTDGRARQVGRGERHEKIRTYNYPNLRVSDHRIKQQWHQLKEIISGGSALHEVLTALQQHYAKERLQQILMEHS